MRIYETIRRAQPDVFILPGTFGPNKRDNTFGIDVVFEKGAGADTPNLPPSAGLQFSGATLWRKTLGPERP